MQTIDEFAQEFVRQYPVGSKRHQLAQALAASLVEQFAGRVLLDVPKDAVVDRIRRCIP